MKQLTKLFAIFMVFASATFAQSEWTFDPTHTTIGFNVTHLVITEVDGKFKKFDGKIVTKDDTFEGAKISFSADVNSIDTENEKRDGHLKAEDFFNAEKFPKLTFEGKSFEKVDEKKYVLTGDLTMRGVTKEVKLDVKFNGIVTDPWGNTKAGFHIAGELNRFDYGLNWNALMEAGGAVVSKEVELDINVQLVKKLDEVGTRN